MKVWILIQTTYNGYDEIIDVYATKELAQFAQVDLAKNEDYDPHYPIVIKECEVIS